MEQIFFSYYFVIFFFEAVTYVENALLASLIYMFVRKSISIEVKRKTSKPIWYEKNTFACVPKQTIFNKP